MKIVCELFCIFMALIRKSRIEIEGQPAAGKQPMDTDEHRQQKKNSPDGQGQAGSWSKKADGQDAVAHFVYMMYRH